MQNLKSTAANSHIHNLAIANSKNEAGRGHMWNQSMNNLFNILNVSERNSYFDVTLGEPLNGYHVKTGIRDLKMHGKSTLYSDKGLKIAILTFEKGVAKGPCTLYDDSGVLFFEGFIKDGYRHGKGKEYDEFGKLIFDGFYEKGERLDNIVPMCEMPKYWKEYDNSGKLISITQRDNYGQYEGLCYFYDEKGAIDCISEWKEGKEVSTTGYYKVYDELNKRWVIGHFENRKILRTEAIKDKQGYRKQYNEDNQLVRVYGEDMEGKYNGICYMYINEHICRISYWEHESEIRVIKQFNGSTMIEYNEEGQKCYEGGFLDSFELDYPRNGDGEEYGRDGKTIIFKGSYSNGRKHGKGICYKDNEIKRKTVWLAGYSKEGLLRTLLAMIVLTLLLFVIDVFLGLAFLVIANLLIIIRWSCSRLLGKAICNRTDLNLMADYFRDGYSTSTKTKKGTKKMSCCLCHNIFLSTVIIVSLLLVCICASAHFYYNLVNPYISVFQTTYNAKSFRNHNTAGFRLSFKPFLKTIEIENQCFEVASVFQIKGLNSLYSVKIGSNSFTEHRNNFGNDGSKSFHILNCKNLQSIEIGEYSFSDFGGDFEIRNLPSLRYLEIGVMNKSSYNFYSVKSFIIEGMEQNFSGW